MQESRASQDLAVRLRRAMRRAGDDERRRLDFAWRLARLGHAPEALEEYARVTLAGRLPIEHLVRLGALALELGHTALAEHCLGAARRAGLEAEAAELRARIERDREDRGHR